MEPPLPGSKPPSDRSTQLAAERARLAFVGTAAALAPMLPLLLTAFSLEDLIHQAIKRLLGI